MTASVKTELRCAIGYRGRSRAVGFMMVSVVSLLGNLVVASALAADNTPPKRILILDSFAGDIVPFSAIARGFRTTLALELGEPAETHQAPLETARFAEPGSEESVAAFLRQRFTGRAPDLVVAVGAPATAFVARTRERLYPNAPILVAGTDRRRIAPAMLVPGTIVVSQDTDLPVAVDNILEVLPDTRNIAVVMGDSPLEKFWIAEMRRAFQPYASRVGFSWFNDLPFAEVQKRAAVLPAQSVILYIMLVTDAAGVPYNHDEALNNLRSVANVPIFGWFEGQLGRGIVGGTLHKDHTVGVEAARTAIGILKGEAPATIGTRLLDKSASAYDWRELQRWGISESRLPAGAEVRFRTPSLWEQHKLLILSGVGIVLFQATLITALLIQRVRRRRAEKEAVDLSGRLLTAHEDERRRLARELHDDLTQRLARLAIDAGRMENVSTAPEGLRPLREDLVRLSEDVHALSYRLHPSVLDDLGLVEALKAECDRVAGHGELRVDVEASGVPKGLPAEASLCLFRVAQEALSNAARHARASAVTVLLSPSGKGLQLAISDNGSGFDPARSRERASLGLASMRERVRLLQGELDIESTAGRGTTVVAWVPA